MPRRHTRKSKSVAVQCAELAVAVPQVVAHRMTRMALAGPVPSERDRREFQQMVAEKQTAFTQAWIAMATESFRASQAITASIFGNIFNPFSPIKTRSATVATDIHRAAMGLVSKGLAPVHRKVVSNAKRLAKTKLR